MLKKNSKTSSKIKIFQNLYYSLFCLLFICSCGFKADPRIPYRDIPLRITDTEIRVFGDLIYLQIHIPDINERGEKKEDLLGIKIYRKLNPLDIDTYAFFSKGEIKPSPQIALGSDDEKKRIESKSQLLGTPKEEGEPTITQESFGFGSEMAYPGTPAGETGLRYDYQPMDFRKNYVLISDINIAEMVEDYQYQYIFIDKIQLPEELASGEFLEISYLILTYDKNFLYSKYSNIFSTWLFYAPDPVHILSCEQTAEGIEIKWKAYSMIIEGNDYTDKISYNIYASPRAELLEDPFLLPLKTIEPGSETYLDKIERNYEQFYYTIRAVLNTRSGTIESQNSNICEAEISLYDEPKPVEGISIFSEQNSVIIIWRPGSERDIIGYNIYRRSGNMKDFTLITEEPVISLRYQDMNLNRGKYYYYITSVVNLDPLIESKPSEVEEVTVR